MTSHCTIHNQPMTERTSKTKFAPDGSPKAYWAHSINGATEGLCFGEGLGKAVRNGRAEDQTNNDVPRVDPRALTPRDPEAEGKTRCQVAVAFIGQGRVLTEDVRTQMNEWVSWIMKG